MRSLVVALAIGLGACASSPPASEVRDELQDAVAVTAAPNPTPSPTLTVLPPISLDEVAGFSDSRPQRIRGHESGEVIGNLSIPRLGIKSYPLRFGIGLDVLALGPGVYPGSAPPGHGNFSMAGHRITPVGPWDHGPFRYVDTLHKGDTAVVRFEGETYTYRFVRNIIVSPADTTVLRDGKADMTFTACHPPGYASERIVTQWRLVPKP